MRRHTQETMPREARSSQPLKSPKSKFVMETFSTNISRRSAMRIGARLSVGVATATCAGFTGAQTRKAIDGDLVLTQIVDVSQAHQDVSKDYLIGSRAGWQEINQRGGVRGRAVRHNSVEIDGSQAELRAAVTSARDNPACMALFGTVSHAAAQMVSQQLQQEKTTLAHIAPWLQVEPDPADVQTFPLFATRQEQIGHAIRNFSTFNVREVGVVYASANEYLLYKGELERSAAAMQLKVQHFRNGTDLTSMGQRFKIDSPSILLFLGGTPELAKFTQGLEQQSRMRYCVAMADVNLQTLAQMGAAKHTPIIVTQVVPMVNAKLPIVRAYRETLARLFDEPPTPLSMAGYIAARYAFEVLNSMTDAPTRQNVLAAFQRAPSIDLGGFRAGGQRKNTNYVTQSMLTADGRLVG